MNLLAAAPTLLGAMLMLSGPRVLHTALEHSSPAADAVLESSPDRIVLTYNVAINLGLSRVRLVRTDSTEVLLDSLRTGDGPQTVVARLLEPVGTGAYTVAWQATGPDGHPVRGSFSFAVSPGSPPDSALPPPATPVVQETAGEGGLTVGSPAYVAIRWLTFAALAVAIGAVAFRFLVLERVRTGAPVAAALVAPAAERAAGVARGALVFLILAAGARLLAQLSALGVGAEDAEMVQVLVTGTLWGWSWLLQVIAAAVGIAAFHAARRSRPGAWYVATGVALALAITPALAGHAAAVETLTPVAVLADTLHLLAMAAWLGTLLFVIGVGMPEAARADPDTAPSAIAAMIGVFSPMALVAAGLVVMTGVVAAAFQLGSLPALWSSSYGRTLLLKVAIVLAVLGAGAYNWRRQKPRLAAATGAEALRRSATVELLAGTVVLLITAILVATPTPGEH